ncbi:MAG: acyltransferase [bacterium]
MTRAPQPFVHTETSIAKPEPAAVRLTELDWLRILAVLMLIYYHTAAMFVHWDSVINNSQGSVWADLFILFMDPWYMSLFFVIAGAAARFSLASRSALQYAGERTRRLLVPLVFGMLVIVPPQVFCQRLQDPVHYDSLPQFYLHLFDGIYPAGDLSWHHLWFVAYLFVFALALLPFFVWLGRGRGRAHLSRAAWVCERPGGIFLPALVLAATDTVLRGRFPGPPDFVHDWASVLFFAIYFAGGYVLYSEDRLVGVVERSLKPALCLALLSTASGVALFLSGKIPGYGSPGAVGSAGWALLMMLRSLNSWSWVLVWLGLARRRLRTRNRFLTYASEAAYPFYILHETVLVVIGYRIVQSDWGVPAKFLAISTAGLVATVASYELLVRRVGTLRFLFGMRRAASGRARPG